MEPRVQASPKPAPNPFETVAKPSEEVAKPSEPVKSPEAIAADEQRQKAIDDRKREQEALALKRKEELDKEHVRIIDNANRNLTTDTALPYFNKYPFEDMKVDQGLFIPVQPNITIAQMIDDMHGHVNEYMKQTSKPEKDELGDDILEVLIIQSKKRDAD